MTVVDFLTSSSLVLVTAEITPTQFTIVRKSKLTQGVSLNMFLSGYVLDFVRDVKNVICIKHTMKNNTWVLDDEEIEMHSFIAKLIYERAAVLNLPVSHLSYEEHADVAEQILIESE